MVLLKKMKLLVMILHLLIRLNTYQTIYKESRAFSKKFWILFKKIGKNKYIPVSKIGNPFAEYCVKQEQLCMTILKYLNNILKIIKIIYFK